MKKLIFSILLASTFTIQQVHTAEESIVGYWLASDSIFEIKNCDDALCGEIVQIFVAEGVDPKSILDNNNMDPELQSRPLIGSILTTISSKQRHTRNRHGNSSKLWTAIIGRSI